MRVGERTVTTMIIQYARLVQFQKISRVEEHTI